MTDNEAMTREEALLRCIFGPKADNRWPEIGWQTEGESIETCIERQLTAANGPDP